MKSYPLQCVSVQMLYLWLFYGWLAIVSRHFFSEHGYIWSIVTGYFINKPAPVDQKVDSAIHWINLYPVDKVIVFANKHPLDNDFPVETAIQPLNDRGLQLLKTPSKEPRLWASSSTLPRKRTWSGGRRKKMEIEVQMKIKCWNSPWTDC